jgi:beta-N-acetylhexosaminidase
MLYLDLFPEADVALLGRYRAGGVMVRRRYAKSTRQLVRLISRHQEEAVQPLFVGANFEWGTGNDTPSGTLFPGLMAIAANVNNTAAVDFARVTAREARALGVNQVISPMLDVVTGLTSVELGTRSGGSDPKAVGMLGRTMIEVFQANKVMCTAKHFPGAGDRIISGMTGLPVQKHDRKYVLGVCIKPFREAIDAGVGCIMVGNMHVPAIMGEKPEAASLSEKVVTGLLREELEYEGLIITENLANGAVSLKPVDACAAAIRAGADLILTKQELLRPDNFADLVWLVEKDKSLVKKVEGAYKRICNAKKELGLFKETSGVLPDEAEKLIGAPENMKVAKRAALGAVTVLRDAKRLLPVKPKKADKIVVVTPRLPEAPLVPTKENWGHVYKVIKDIHPATTPAYVSFSPTGDEVEKAIRASARSEYVIVVLSHEAGHEIDGSQAALANAIGQANARTIAVVLGNPFAVKQISDKIGTVLLTYSNMPLSQEAAAEVVLGKAIAKGRLPVAL